jgi:predicted nucleic acid-binding protein
LISYLSGHEALAGVRRRHRRWIEQLSDQAITYTDAVSFAVMQTARCTAAMSFDRDFVTAGFELWRPDHAAQG